MRNPATTKTLPALFSEDELPRTYEKVRSPNGVPAGKLWSIEVLPPPALVTASNDPIRSMDGRTYLFLFTS